MTDLAIHLYSEIACPWCLIGLHRLDKVLSEHFPSLSVDVVHHPVLLMPDVPASGVRIADLLHSRYGITDLTQAWAGPEAAARASGLELDLSYQPFAYPTQGAHTLIRWARQRSTQHALAVAITRAYFLKALNIADLDVLASIAADYGFSKEEAHSLAANPVELQLTLEEASLAGSAGVRSVPHMIFNDEITLVGGRSEDELKAAIGQAISSNMVVSR